MVSVGRHPNITLLSYSEVEKVAGYVGNFNVTVRRKPRYVNEDLCTGCGTCIEKCPWKKIPSEFDLGLGNRPAIYYPFPQAVPRVPVIDTENCAYFKSGKCRACEKFCSAKAIDFEQKEQQVEIEVGTIILATGFKDFDPRTVAAVWLRHAGQRADRHGNGTADQLWRADHWESAAQERQQAEKGCHPALRRQPRRQSTNIVRGSAACTRSNWPT